MSLRRYLSGDEPNLRDFRCAHYGARWERDAERIIRDAPEDVDNVSVFVIVAEHGSEIVGAVVYGVGREGAIAGIPVIFSLGVAIAWKRQHIGTDLKLAALEDIVRRQIFDSPWVLSEVHRANFQMAGLNQKIGTLHVPNPEDREYNFHGIRPILAPSLVEP